MTASDLIGLGRSHEQAGRLGRARDAYARAADTARDELDAEAEAEALRRLGVVHHLRHEESAATKACQASHSVAIAAGRRQLAAEALNTLGAFDLEAGAYEAAEATFQKALAIGEETPALRGRIEQNLGILANIRGDLTAALAHYRRSLEAFEAGSDKRGCALAHHNLGMISADQSRWDDADQYFRASSDFARATGDVHLQGLCHLNRTEVHLARRRYRAARRSAEAALRIFRRLRVPDGKAAAYRFLGMVHRETGSFTLAKSRLTRAVELAQHGRFPLEEAEALRELALLYQRTEHNQDALHSLNASHRLFRRLEAKRDVVDIAAKVTQLEATYLATVRAWGESIESTDRYTFGHCERVASYALEIAHQMGLDEIARTTIRVGAYLHDVGKVRVPPEILNKAGRLRPQELQLMQRHPLYGVELLEGIEFPWDINPIIRWHHEKLDGSGYPHGLRGDAIPLAAQIICIADVYDALTTTRSYRAALPKRDALAQMEECRGWWRPEVYAAFLATAGSSAGRSASEVKNGRAWLSPPVQAAVA